jgi:hypothetical protein
MSGVIIIAAGAVIVVGAAIWAWISRDNRGHEHDMGTISGQWIAEHRSQERQSDGR